MSDLEIIKQIEKQSGFTLKQLPYRQIYNDEYQVFEKEELEEYGLGLRAYSLDQNKNITALSLDYIPSSNYDYNPILKLSRLKALSIESGEVFDIKFFSSLKYLKSLNNLDLSNNVITDISFLKDLKGLTSLDLGSNQINDISVLRDLTSLTSLDLSFNQINFIFCLEKLKSLTKLNLNSNPILNFFLLKNLTNLTDLDLISNSITDVSFLKDLKGLTRLDLKYNQITDISYLKDLKDLIWLDLSYNQITDISNLKDLKSLTSLYLNKNLITDISFLKDLENLNSLDLSFNQITDISNLKDMKSLTSLYLMSNQITDINFFKDLQSLTILSLRDNQISDIIILKDLKSLIYLDLSKNPIKMLEEWICDFPKMDIKWKEYTFSGIVFYNNPIKKPPIEIIKQGKEAVKDYFEEIKEGFDFIYEAKLLIIGEPGAGKTTLYKKMQNNDYFPDRPRAGEIESTLGINIFEGWQFPYSSNHAITFSANLWDFGGQPQQYLLHQYFLTNRSLYVLMADDRKQLTNFHYWFEIIGTLGGQNCQVIVVLNEIGHKSVSNFDLSEYSKHFPHLQITKNEVDFVKNDKRFYDLLSEIKTKLSCLPHIGSKLPKQWIPIRKKLEEIKKSGNNYISLDDYEELCKEYGLKTDRSIRLILRYFHDLGIALHYTTDLNLRSFVILNPNWVVDALYSVLVDKTVINDSGRFHTDWIYKHWKAKSYNNTDCALLLGLMQKGRFEICYPLPNCGQKYIVPALLPYNSPKYSFDYNETLQLQFQYEFMPPGILWRLIVRQNNLICKQNQEEIVWQRGVLFEQNNAIAEVLEIQEHKRIEIRISGNKTARKNLLTEIRNEIKKIHEQWFDNRLRFTELVPCICDTCLKSDVPHFYKLSEQLQYRLNNNKFTIDCDKKPFLSVNILQLLGEVYNMGIETNQLRNFDDFIRLFKSGRLDKQTIVNITNIIGSGNKVFQDIERSQLDIDEDNSFSQTQLSGRSGKKELLLLEKIEKNTEQLKKDHIEIKSKLDEYFKYLIQIPENASRAEEINTETENLIHELNTNLKEGLEEFMEQSFAYIYDRFEDLDQKQQAIYLDLKKGKPSENWKTKVKLSIPLINLIGIKVEHEFYLNKYLKKLKEGVKKKLHLP